MEIELSRRDKEKGLVLPEKMTPELAYLLGVFAGDGSICHRPEKYEYELKCVGNPKDEKEFYHKIISPTFEKVFGFEPKVKSMDGGTTYGFRVYSKALCKCLIKLGVPKAPKYSKLRIPKALHNKLIFAFLRGVYDTDGCISFKNHGKTKYPVVSIVSKSENFIREISEIIKIIDIPSYNTYGKKIIDDRLSKGYCHRSSIEIYGRNNVRKWMRTIGFSSPKHLKKIKEKW